MITEKTKEKKNRSVARYKLNKCGALQIDNGNEDEYKELNYLGFQSESDQFIVRIPLRINFLHSDPINHLS